jgi:hypothetical protein
MGHLRVPLDACVPWSIDEGSKDQSRIIVMVLDGSMEQRNSLKEGFHGATSVVVAKEEFDCSLLVNFHILCSSTSRLPLNF